MAKAVEKIDHYYVIRDPKIQGGEPIIRGTRFPVRSVVFYVIKEGMLPEELAREFPQLSLSSIYDALSYYYDNKEEIENLLENQKEALWKK
ncbi:MAG TPA: DUF433 domain-containing protein [Candidatus Atribacteria bacterium]|nr:DUF433 domain-containing protein [Candidatus Atribacteria bacterium]